MEETGEASKERHILTVFWTPVFTDVESRALYERLIT